MFLKILQKSQEKISAKISFLIKLQAQFATLLKRDSGIGIICEFCKILKSILFCRAPPEDCFCVYSGLADIHSVVGQKLFQLR